MTIVNVVDAPCGYGKTSWAIQYMSLADTGYHRFIFVTPFVKEVGRVKEIVTNRTFFEPVTDKTGMTKLEDLHRLLGEGKDIATTHALFKLANAETRELIRINNYTLILDEVMDVIEQVPLKKNSLDLLLSGNTIEIVPDDNGLKYIRWMDDKKGWDTDYNYLKSMALSGNLMFCDSSALIWNMPCEMFKLFEEVYILTYLFKGQLQRYYYDLHGIKYRYLSVFKDESGYSLEPYTDRRINDKSHLQELVSVYEGHLNSVGDKTTALSTSWFEKATNKELVTSLKRNTYNYLTNYCKAKISTSLWTVVKGNNDRIKKMVMPRGFKDAFIPMTMRATNDYIDKHHLVYLMNRFMNPIEKKFFEQYGVSVQQDTWAISELIQWVWRSRIRTGQSIQIYIPSRRMRDLFHRYLTTNYFETPPENAIIDEPPTDWNI
ncbi:DEAD/DEAH box helicase family protein [Paenibacillus sacheonensis]|uniref:Helicase/UvrB N-terminal domain-containing protein n=1 Tax=Paenibacillus sacheonensis TaxID=742054 RepID=A0A7X5C114_9BACL|nr:DEAD/DEAH box helicase family protein [Paenibacillus sacheonensis]MBM7565762.1 hypothetical protein [Paenibacillus sacheonensis]NBC72181.1 hypothetical protein [Paenibacillus sacheonensis]